MMSVEKQAELVDTILDKLMDAGVDTLTEHGDELTDDDSINIIFATTMRYAVEMLGRIILFKGRENSEELLKAFAVGVAAQTLIGVEKLTRKDEEALH